MELTGKEQSDSGQQGTRKSQGRRQSKKEGSHLLSIAPFLPFSFAHRLIVVQQWSQGRVKEKLNNKVYFDKKAYAQLLKEVPKMRVITVSRVSESLGIIGGMAKLGIAHLEKEGLITPVVRHSGQIIYTNVIPEAAEEKIEVVAHSK